MDLDPYEVTGPTQVDENDQEPRAFLIKREQDRQAFCMGIPEPGQAGIPPSDTWIGNPPSQYLDARH